MLSLKRVFAGLVIFLATLVAASEFWPERTAKIMLAGLNAAAGLEKKTVETSLGPVTYLEGGTGETVVFVHGIFALKEHWIDMSRQLSNDYHVVLLDLPGFGENARLDPAEYDFARQTQNVIEVLDAIGIDQMHLAANSMGAQISGNIATMHPERVRSVAFIGSPVGVTSPTPSDMETAIATGHLPLVVTSEADYRDRMAWLFPDEPFVPRPIARTWMAEELSHASINRPIWDAVHASDGPRLEAVARRIAQPSLILWCEEDRIFHISGAAVLSGALPNNRLITATECGHLPMLDRPAFTGQTLLDFLKGIG